MQLKEEYKRARAEDMDVRGQLSALAAKDEKTGCGLQHARRMAPPRAGHAALAGREGTADCSWYGTRPDKALAGG